MEKNQIQAYCEEISMRALFLRDFQSRGDILLLPDDMIQINKEYYMTYGAIPEVVEELPKNNGYIASLAIQLEDGLFYAGLTEKNLLTSLEQIREVCKRHGIDVRKKEDNEA